MVVKGGGGCWSINCLAHFSTQSFHCIFIMISMKQYGEKTNKTKLFPWLVSMEVAAIYNFKTGSSNAVKSCKHIEDIYT